MLCRQCQFENPPQMKFCVECGGRLMVPCPRCSAEMLPSYKFCGECGAPLKPLGASRRTAPPTVEAPSSNRGGEDAGSPTTAGGAAAFTRSPAEGERKRVSVLFCEFVLTAKDPHGEPGDPGMIHGLLDRFSASARTDVQAYGGTINRFLSRGFLALFGAPVAHEDHARRAVLAALGVMETLATRSAEHGSDDGFHCRARIGLDSGPVIVGGTGSTVVGEPLEMAETLQKLATPGTILVSSRTANLVGTHVELESVESQDRGLEEVFRVVRRRSGLGDGRPIHPDEVGQFVGREHELAVLGELCALAERNRGQVVLIAGEAGSGKSRFLQELYRRNLAETSVSYLRGRCLPYSSGVPCLPLIGMIRGASRISETDRPDVVTAKMSATLEGISTDPEGSLPFLLRLLGVDEGTDDLDRMEPQAIQSSTFATMRRMLLDASRKSLVVMELEDVQWIDKTSDEFLSSLIEVMGAARMILILTYRSGYRPPWRDRSYVTQITMQRLSEDESRQLVHSILERSGLPRDLGGDVLAKAEGNPLFLEELARSLVDHGTESSGSIPDTIQEILMARIDGLPEQHKYLLKTASVLGREFSLDLLERLLDRPLPLRKLVDDLRSWELLYKAPSEDRTVHFFKHALTQEVAYESLLAPRRHELHGRAARIFEELAEGHPEDAYEHLIYHYPRAGESEKTVHYLTLFAARAARSYAHAEAAKALREALPHVERLSAESRDRRLVEVLLQLADSLLPLAGFPETLELFERHAGIVEKLDDPSLSAQYFFWLAHTHTYLGNQEETRRFADLSVAAARECGDETTEGKACYVLGRDGFWSGRFKEGIESSLRAVVLLERSGEPWWQGQAYWVAGFNHYVLGEVAKAIEALERARAIGEALDDYRLDTSWSLGYFHASLGDWATGIEQCRKGLERSRDPLNTAVATGFLGHAYLEKRDLPQAIETLRDSVERLRGTGMQQILGWFSTFLGEAYLLDGRLAEARDLAAQGLEITREVGFWYGVGLAQRALGRVARRDGRLGDSKTLLGEALETFSSLEVPFEVARTRLDLAGLARADDEAAASRELEDALATFLRLGVPIYADRVRALADELSLPAPEPSSSG